MTDNVKLALKVLLIFLVLSALNRPYVFLLVIMHGHRQTYRLFLYACTGISGCIDVVLHEDH